MPGPLPITDVVRQRIHAWIDSIPPGRVSTYGRIAAAAGVKNPRQVGAALRGLPAGSALPWYRVVNAAGRISPRPGAGPREQRRRLRAEGVDVAPNGRIDLGRFLWTPPD